MRIMREVFLRDVRSDAGNSKFGFIKHRREKDTERKSCPCSTSPGPAAIGLPESALDGPRRHRDVAKGPRKTLVGWLDMTNTADAVVDHPVFPKMFQ